MATALRIQWALAGAVFALLAGDAAERRRAAATARPLAIAARPAAQGSSGALAGPGSWGARPRAPILVHPRALRAARGVGRLRALDVADHAWSVGPPGAVIGRLESIPGVGPRTAEAIRQVLGDDGFPLHSCRWPPTDRDRPSGPRAPSRPPARDPPEGRVERGGR